ncbi:tryptophan 2,3-dioxygenase family protein [Streptomyces sp. NPDC048644]|uniref:tryptophan 2,3-dioxygenase family protein n=1 Tax=Streptomyces sp. NPDC048644 TaxID=3365582 RepID=UPI0037110448
MPSSDAHGEVPMSESPYADYLRLDALLALQHPRTPAAEAQQWADERLFIVVHQSAELLAGQTLTELRLAARQAGAPGAGGAALASVRRAHALLALLTGHLSILDHLETAGFAAFRDLLGEASGCQSTQFSHLFAQICAPDAGLPLHDGTPADGEADELRVAVRSVQEAVAQWRAQHLLLVERMIGDDAGTAGSSGLAHLRSRAEPSG